MIRRLFNNASSNYANMVISIVIAFIMSPFLVHRLGDFYFGLWTLIMSFAGYFSLLDFGMNRAIVRYVSMYEATEQKNELNKFFNTSLILYTCFGLITVFATLIITYFFDRIVDLKGYVMLGKLVVLIVGFDAAFTFPFGVMYAVLIARQEHTIANRINITNAIARNIFLYTAIIISPHLLCLALVNVAFNMTKNFRIYRTVRKNCPHILYNRRYFDRKLIPDIFNYSLYSFIVSVSSRVISFTDEIVVATFLRVSDVTYYSIATNLVTYFEKLIWAGASVFVPYISQLDARGEQELVKQSFFRGSKYTLLMTLYIFCGIYLLGGDFVGIWMGEKYGAVVKPILLVLAFAKAISMGQSMSVARFFGTNRHHLLGKLNMLEAASNLILSLILVRSYGMIGVAYGTLIPSCILNGILLPVIAFREFKVSYLDFLLKSVLGPSAAFFATIFSMLKIGTHSAGYPSLLFQGGLMTMVFCFFSLVLVTDSVERTVLLSRLRVKHEA